MLKKVLIYLCKETNTVFICTFVYSICAPYWFFRPGALEDIGRDWRKSSSNSSCKFFYVLNLSLYTVFTAWTQKKKPVGVKKGLLGGQSSEPALPSVGYLRPRFMPKRTWTEVYYQLDVSRIATGAHIKTYLGTKTTLLYSMYERARRTKSTFCCYQQWSFKYNFLKCIQPFWITLYQ